MSVLRSRVCVRHSRTCAGGIHASGKRPSASNIRNQRASARSVLAWRFLPRSALVSAASARCTTTPALAKTSYTNSQPVHASNATSTCSPTNCATHSPTASRSARNRPRKTSPVSVSSASKVICARCTSNPARIAIRGLLCSSEVPTASLSHRAEGVPTASGPDPGGHAIFSTTVWAHCETRSHAIRNHLRPRRRSRRPPSRTRASFHPNVDWSPSTTPTELREGLDLAHHLLGVRAAHARWDTGHGATSGEPIARYRSGMPALYCVHGVPFERRRIAYCALTLGAGIGVVATSEAVAEGASPGVRVGTLNPR